MATVVQEGDGTRGSGRPFPWALASLALAVVASLVLLFAPLGTEVSATAPTGPPDAIGGERVTHPSLLQTQGWSVAVPLSVPVILTAAGALAARRRWRRLLVVIAGLLGVGIVLGALSIGIFYLPAEAALVVAIAKGRGP